ncbi:MAG: polyprenyl synthetase family protein [Candidatus Caenarcaniphilales bacterium]|nr:polyprenyl synthetase family protein [Candidatus Caenarcaniphilales bacterium]
MKSPLSVKTSKTFSSSNIGELFVPIQADLKEIDRYFEEKLTSDAGFLKDVIKYLMLSGGKRLRPSLALLCGYISSKNFSLNPKHYTLARLSELIHTASLVHDDFIDQADSRRGKETGHLQFGARVAVIAGDYLFAQASISLGELENTEIVKIYAEVLSRLCAGEIAQAQARFDLKAVSLESYTVKSTWKTASLFAAAARSAALLNQAEPLVVEAMHQYGLNLGLAFQVIDDLIDVTSSSSELGKPAMSDLANGIITAPVLYALQDPTHRDKMINLIGSAFPNGEGLSEAQEIILNSSAVTETQKLARSYGANALTSLHHFSDSPYKRELIDLVDFVLERKS